MPVCAYFEVLTAYLLSYVASIPVFVLAVHLGQVKGLVKYSLGPYVLSQWLTGASNAFFFYAVKKSWIKDLTRWRLQSFGWILVMNGPIWLEIFMTGRQDTYELNTAQIIRYSTFNLSLYTFVYYGICGTYE